MNNIPTVLCTIMFAIGLVAGLYFGTTNIENLDLPDNIEYIRCERGFATMHWKENTIQMQISVKSVTSHDAFMSLLKKVHERNKHGQ